VRTGDLHVALASSLHDPAFSPEPFDADYQHGLAQSIRMQVHESLRLLQRRLDSLPEEAASLAGALLQREELLLRRVDVLLTRPFRAVRIRCHGDYHLGQVLHTGDDFVIIDFEGEPARPIPQRRVKHSPLQDVAGMLRSFAYAAQAAPRTLRQGEKADHRDAALVQWLDVWKRWVSREFLRGYLGRVAGTPAWPAANDDMDDLLDALVLDKALYELRYELNNRPHWSAIPVANLLQLTATSAS
jgi:maltose alpha-D-glucosyltransferase/alpha-amylase